MQKISKYTALAFAIALVFVFSTFAAYQGLWSAIKPFKAASGIFLVAFSSTAPACFFYVLARYSQSRRARFYWYLLTAIITGLSLMAWASSAIVPKAPPGGGAQHMHLLIWPIYIPIVSLLLFIGCVVIIQCFNLLRLLAKKLTN